MTGWMTCREPAGSAIRERKKERGRNSTNQSREREGARDEALINPVQRATSCCRGAEIN